MQITGGFLKSRKIDSPKTSNVRPTLSQIRESIFSTLFSMTDFEELSFLDLFAGSGIMGFEAISRGFAKADFIEKDKKTFYLIKSNAKKLGLKNNQVDFCLGDSLKVLKKLQKTYDIIYVDPPYMGGFYDDVLDTIFSNKLLNTNGIIILEHPKSLDIKTENYNIIKQKVYADKVLTFLCLR